MSKEPDTLPIYIAEKLDALGTNPKEDDLEAIRVLLYTYQEERVISDEELQEWKKLEKRILENQNTYKKETEDFEKRAKYYTPLYMLLALLINLCVKISQFIIGFEFPEDSFQLVFFWPIDFIVVGIYLYYFHGSDLWLEFLAARKSVQHEVLENEDEDWEDSMTSTELQSRQKALLNQWKQLKKGKNEILESSFLMFLVQFVIMIYFWIREFAIMFVSIGFFSFFTGTEIFILVVEYFVAHSLWLLFLEQFLTWRKKSNENESINEKSD